MTFFRAVLIVISAFKCVPILPFPLPLSLDEDTNEGGSGLTGQSAPMRIVFYPLPVAVQSSKVDDVLHKDPEELQHILEKPFMASHVPEIVAQRITDILKNPVLMDLDSTDESSLALLKDQLIFKEEQPPTTTPEPEESVTFFTEELSAVSDGFQAQDPTTERRPPVKLLQRLLRGYLPVVHPEVEKTTPPAQAPLISLPSEPFKPAYSMKFPVSGDGHYALLNALNIILNRKILSPCKSLPQVQISRPTNNVTSPQSTVITDETLLKPTVFDAHLPPFNGTTPDESAISPVTPPTHDYSPSVTSQQMTPSGNPELSSTFSPFLYYETPFAPTEDSPTTSEDEIGIEESLLPYQPYSTVIETFGVTDEISTAVDEVVTFSTSKPNPIDTSDIQQAEDTPLYASTGDESLITSSAPDGDLHSTEHTTLDEIEVGESEISTTTTNQYASSDLLEASTNSDQPNLVNPSTNSPDQPWFLDSENMSETSHHFGHTTLAPSHSYTEDLTETLDSLSTENSPDNQHESEETTSSTTDFYHSSVEGSTEMELNTHLSITENGENTTPSVDEGSDPTENYPTTIMILDSGATVFETHAENPNPTVTDEISAEAQTTLLESMQHSTTVTEDTTPTSENDFSLRVFNEEDQTTISLLTTVPAELSSQVEDLATVPSSTLHKPDIEGAKKFTDEIYTHASSQVDSVFTEPATKQTSFYSVEFSTTVVPETSSPFDEISLVSETEGPHQTTEGDGTSSTLNSKPPVEEIESLAEEDSKHEASITPEPTESSNLPDDFTPESTVKGPTTDDQTETDVPSGSSTTTSYPPEDVQDATGNNVVPNESKILDETTVNGSATDRTTAVVNPTDEVSSIDAEGLPSSELTTSGGNSKLYDENESSVSNEIPEEDSFHPFAEGVSPSADHALSEDMSTLSQETESPNLIQITESDISTVPAESESPALSQVTEDKTTELSAETESSALSPVTEGSIPPHPAELGSAALNQVTTGDSVDVSTDTESSVLNQATEVDVSNVPTVTERPSLSIVTTGDNLTNEKEVTDLGREPGDGETEGTPSANSPAENDGSEDAFAQKDTSESYSDSDDLIHSTADPTTVTVEATDRITRVEGETSRLFLGGDQVTGKAPDVLPTTSRPGSSVPPAMNFTTPRTPVPFTDPEEEEIQDSLDCANSTTTEKAPSSQTSLKILDPPSSEAPSSFENGTFPSQVSPQDERLLFQQFDKITKQPVDFVSAEISSLERTTPKTSKGYLVQELDAEDVPVAQADIQRLGAVLPLPPIPKQKAEKLLDLLSGELFVEGADWEDGNDPDEDNYEVDGAGMKILKNGQRKGKWIENLSNDELMALIESIKQKHFRS